MTLKYQEIFERLKKQIAVIKTDLRMYNGPLKPLKGYPLNRRWQTRNSDPPKEACIYQQKVGHFYFGWILSYFAIDISSLLFYRAASRLKVFLKMTLIAGKKKLGYLIDLLRLALIKLGTDPAPVVFRK